MGQCSAAAVVLNRSRPGRWLNGRFAFGWELLLGGLILLSVWGLGAAEAWGEVRNPAWARPIDLPPVENFHEVAPGLYRSAQPSAKAFAELEKFGIVTVINLREKHSDAVAIQGTSLRLIEVPVDTWKVGDEEVIAVLTLIKNEPRPILIHCMHGADRTGLMMAVYRVIFEGWSREEAWEELKEGGYGYHKMWINIPKYLETFDRGKIERAVKGDG